MGKMIIVVLLISTFSYGKMFNISKFGAKLAGKNVDKVIKTIKKSNFTKNLPKVKLNKGLRPELATVTAVAKKIAQKGDFEDKLISQTAHPAILIQQYARYGDAYLDTMKHFSKKALTISSGTVKRLNQKFPNMPNISFKSTQEFNDKVVQTLKYTGKKGWQASQELFKLAKKYPKSTAVAGLYGWYITDPESFFKYKEKLLSFVSSTLKEGVADVTKVTLNASSGIADGFIESFKEKATVSNILVLFLVFFLFIIWKLRTYIKRYLKIKLENSLENTRKESYKNTYTQKNKDDEGEGLL